MTGATFNPFIETGRSYLRYVAKELNKHPSFKSDLVMGMASFDYSTLLVLSRPQAIECYRHLFQSFSSRRWLAKELKNVQMDDYVEFVDDLRHVYLDNVISGPVIDDMVTFCLIVLSWPAGNMHCTSSNYVVCVLGTFVQLCELWDSVIQ